MKGKLLGVITVALLLVLVFAVVAQAAVSQSTIDAIIDDAADGTIDGNWTAAPGPCGPDVRAEQPA